MVDVFLVSLRLILELLAYYNAKLMYSSSTSNAISPLLITYITHSVVSFLILQDVISLRKKYFGLVAEQTGLRSRTFFFYTFILSFIFNLSHIPKYFSLNKFSDLFIVSFSCLSVLATHWLCVFTRRKKFSVIGLFVTVASGCGVYLLIVEECNSRDRMVLAVLLFVGSVFSGFYTVFMKIFMERRKTGVINESANCVENVRKCTIGGASCQGQYCQPEGVSTNRVSCQGQYCQLEGVNTNHANEGVESSISKAIIPDVTKETNTSSIENKKPFLRNQEKALERNCVPKSIQNILESGKKKSLKKDGIWKNLKFFEKEIKNERGNIINKMNTFNVWETKERTHIKNDCKNCNKIENIERPYEKEPDKALTLVVNKENAPERENVNIKNYTQDIIQSFIRKINNENVTQQQISDLSFMRHYLGTTGILTLLFYWPMIIVPLDILKPTFGVHGVRLAIHVVLSNILSFSQNILYFILVTCRSPHFVQLSGMILQPTIICFEMLMVMTCFTKRLVGFGCIFGSLFFMR